jgi:hypothetical protein
MTAMSLCRAVNKGMPMRERHRAYVLGKVMAAIKDVLPEIKEKAKAAKTVVKAPTIQDRLNEKLAEVIGEIEGQVDNVFKNKPSTFKVYDYLATKNVAQAQIGKIRAVFEKQIDELTIAFQRTDEQLAEAYAHVKKADMKRIGEFYVKLMADLDSYAQVKKATRQAKAKVKKPVPKDKLIAKVKYLKEDKLLKVVSINPADIIGAQAVWVFNVKTRKLGKYVADSHAGTLGIKGTSIVGYAEGTSVQKTLRKPDEQLKEFAKAGKVALRTFLKDIRAVEIKLNGRLSADILILKVE